MTALTELYDSIKVNYGTEPLSPTDGQLWYDGSSNILKVYNTTWKTLVDVSKLDVTDVKTLKANLIIELTKLPSSDITKFITELSKSDSIIITPISVPSTSTKYQIKFSDSDKLPREFNITDGISDNSTSLKLFPKGASNYGNELWNNLIHLMENFCNGGPGPNNPVEGQLWYNNDDNILNICKKVLLN